MGLASGKSWKEWGGAVRIQLVSSRVPVVVPQLLQVLGNLVVRYLAIDTPSLFQHRRWLRPSMSQYNVIFF